MVAAAALGLVLRLAFALLYWTAQPMTRDEHEYLALARGIVTGAGFTYPGDVEIGTGQQVGRAPGYPLFLALLDAGRPVPQAVPTRVKVAQSFVGALIVWLIGLLAFNSVGPRAGVAAALVAAVYPPLIVMAAYALSETVYCALALGTALVLQKAVDRSDWRLGALAGAVAGAATLTRPAMLVFLALAGTWILLRRQYATVIALAVAAAVIVAPWTLRNVRVYDRFVLIASEGGVTFWTGNHPLARGEGDLAANPDLKRADLAFRAAHPGLTPEELEPLYYRDALRWIADNPAAWIALVARKTFYTIVLWDRPMRYTPSDIGRVDGAVRDRAALRDRRDSTALAQPAASERLAPARRVVGSRGPGLLSAGTFSFADHRSRADSFRRGAGGPPAIVTAPPQVLVVVPTYNEKDNLPVLAKGVLAHDGFRMLVVDDGSPDGTGAVADALAAEYPGRVEVMHRTGPRGLGRSYVDGLQRAIAQPDVSLVCQMDADLSHNPEYLPALAAGTVEHDVVIGSRYLNGVSVVNWPLHRIFLSAFANKYIRAVTSLTPRDCTSGFRCWRRESLARLPLNGMVSDGYAFLVEMLFEASRHGCRIGEVPIIFVERRQGQSKVSSAVLIESLIMPWRLVLRGRGRS